MGDVKQVLLRAVDSLARVRLPYSAMKYIRLYATLVAIGCALYITGWCSLWYVDKRPNIEEMRQFITTVTNPAWVAAVAFISKMLVDKDADGIPDDIEEEKE